MKAYITDEELLQQVQKLADKLPPEERLLILNYPCVKTLYTALDRMREMIRKRREGIWGNTPFINDLFES